MDNHIITAIKIIENKTLNGPIFQNYRPVHIFSTENNIGLAKSVNLHNKKVITVNSSGDHPFNMLLENVELVESYDINIFSDLFYYLKEAAIRVLNYDEFLAFFFPTILKNKVFDDIMFFKILPHIRDEKAQRFWYILFTKYGGKKLYYSNLFIQNVYSKSTYIACNKYLNNETNYKALQQKLRNYNHIFYQINLFGNLTDFPNKKYDFIYLSNILDKYSCHNELEFVTKVKQLIASLKPHLTEEGLIGVCYLYCYLDGYWDSMNNRPLSSADLRKIYFDDNYEYKDFRGINDFKSDLRKNRDALMLTLKNK